MTDYIELITGLRTKIRNEIIEFKSKNVIIIATINNSNLLSVLRKIINIKNELIIIGSDKR